MSLMSLGADFLVRMREKGGRLMSLGVLLMSLGAGFEQELGDEFGGDFDEFDEFGGHFLVCLRQQNEFDEFGGAFDEFGRGFGRGAWR